METASLSKRFAWNSVMIWLSSLISAAAALLVVPFLIEDLGDKGYGLVVLVTTVVGFAMMADLGVRHALIRHLAARVAKQEDREVSECFSSAIAVCLAIAGAFAIACVTLAPALVDFLEIEQAQRLDAIRLFQYYASYMILVAFLTPAFAAMVEAHHRFDLSNLIHIVEVVLRTAFILGVVWYSDWQIFGWAAAMAAARTIGLLLFIYMAWTIRPTLRVGVGLVNRQALRDLFALSIPLGIHRGVRVLGILTDPLILTRIVGIVGGALYEPAQKAVTAAAPFALAINRQVQPLAAGFYATGNHKAVADTLIRATRYSFLLGVLFVVVMGSLSHHLVRAWLWDSLGENLVITSWVLVVWCVVEFFNNAGGTQFAVLVGVNRVRFVVTLKVVLAGLNLIASIVTVSLMYRAGYGYWSVLGVVLPTAVAALIQPLVTTPFTARVVGVPLRRYLREAYLGPTAVFAILLGLGVLIRLYLPLEASRWMLAAEVLGAAVTLGLAWLALSWVLALDAKDKQQIMDLAARTLRRLRRSSSGLTEP